MIEFKSELETLLPCKELLFKSTPGFGDYKPFLKQATSHPAKMNTTLTKYLVETLTKEDDVILDPMSGSGSTGVIAALLGRNAVCVELEEKFHKWQLQAKEKVYDSPMLTRKGSLSCIKGDARNLSELLQTADAIVTSPPYAQSASGNDRREFWERLAKDPTSCRYGRESHPHTAEAYGLTKDNIGNLPMGEISAVITSPPYSGSITGSDPNPDRRAQRMLAAGYDPKTLLGGERESRVAIIEWRYAKREDKANIGNLAHGKIDAVITSPPYSEGIGHVAGENASHDYEARLEMQQKYTDQMVSEGNIATLKHGEVDAVIMSPTYEASVSDNKEGPGGGANKEIYGRWKEGTAQKNSYIQHGEPCKVDAVITSPPYDEGAGHGGGKDLHLQDEKKLYLHGAGSYSVSKDNIGEMRKETYLQAMLTVYSEMFKVLKTNGTAAIVVKPFIRNRTVIDLPYQTWLLMQKCGFQLTKLFKLRLEQQSFWRILYMKKNPEVPQIWHEYVLVCAKPLDSGISKYPSKTAA